MAKLINKLIICVFLAYRSAHLFQLMTYYLKMKYFLKSLVKNLMNGQMIAISLAMKLRMQDLLPG